MLLKGKTYHQLHTNAQFQFSKLTYCRSPRASADPPISAGRMRLFCEMASEGSDRGELSPSVLGTATATGGSASHRTSVADHFEAKLHALPAWEDGEESAEEDDEIQHEFYPSEARASVGPAPERFHAGVDAARPESERTVETMIDQTTGEMVEEARREPQETT